MKLQTHSKLTQLSQTGVVDALALEVLQTEHITVAFIFRAIIVVYNFMLSVRGEIDFAGRIVDRLQIGATAACW